MNKTELVVAMMEKSGLSKKDTEKALKAFTDTVSAELKKGGTVQLIGFGSFSVVDKPERVYFGKKVAACKAPKFKPGKALKGVVNN